ncbi:NB-ARC domain, LRR domain containing protein [Trema orientale]|uniref:NB-ARC domain, LRR domain containing protein n=1 Tax=Trema orientale TaxID=63057 RepID=A0A2P5EMA7_TREOI|nr:NB-ARC domain, LRR domain containing protein [Trema orientale]
MDLAGGNEASTSLTLALDKLVSLLTGEDKLLKGVELLDVHSLRDELEQLKLFLEQAHVSSEDEEHLNHWSKQIKQVAELIQDVVDDYIHKVSQRPHERPFINFLGKAGRLIGTLNSRPNLASNIRYIKALLVEVKKTGRRSNLTTTIVERYYPQSVSQLIGDCFVGLDLIERLDEEADKRPVISVLGIEDPAELDLLKKTVKNRALRENFDCHAWIDASQKTNMAELLKIMAKEICTAEKQNVLGEIGSGMMPMEELACIVSRYLRSKKYMLVFHDVRPVEFWKDVKNVLPNNDKGSKIIITWMKFIPTSVDISFDRFPVFHEPEPLSEAICWDLFCGIAFQYETDQHCPLELEQLSHQFIRMCESSPLAIVATAELLSEKEKTVSEWKTLLDNFSSEVESNFHQTGASKILLCSYLDLPPQLKLCFLYFSIFPKHYLIPYEKLYKLWIAEGFVQKKRGKTLEMVAEEYLNELITRNLVQASQGFYDLEKFCRVHSLVHEIAVQKADELSFCRIWDGKKSRLTGKICRLSVCNHDVANYSDTNEDSQICSVFLSNIGALDKSFMVTLFEKCKFLTLLDFENVPLDHIPYELGNLFHLKYLSFKNTKVKKLPKSVGKLHNLQTLDLRNTLLTELPFEINKLQNLRHLLASGYKNKISSDSTQGVRIYKGIGNLENLQTLMTVDAHLTGISLIKDVQKLRQMRRLGISRLTAEVSSAVCTYINNMSHLESLSLHSAEDNEILNLHTISSPLLFLQRLVLKGQLQKLPDCFSRLQNLSILCLSFSRLSIDHLDYLSRLRNLVSLWLYRAYDGEQLHFVEGGFPKLKLLVLRELLGLKVVEIGKGSLPHLEELRIGSSPLLNEVPSGIQHLTNLKVVANYDMPSEYVFKMQPDGGSDYSKVEHLPSVLFWYKVDGRRYILFKLGEPELLDHLQGLDSNINVVAQHDVRLSFYYSDDEEDSASIWNDVNRFSFSSDRVSFFSDDIED